jgi:EAL and modified HD-GYP domain-containing signal transduction protein
VWVHVGQQPIVDTGRSVVAYEILFRSAAHATSAQVHDAEESTAQVLTATFLEFGLTDLVGDRLAFINMPRGFLVGRWPLPFEAGRVVLEVLEDVQADDEVIAGISRLAQAGYAIALDDVTAARGREELLHLADYVKLDLLDIDPADLPALLDRCAGAGRRIIAEKIETPEQLALCKGLGIGLFQGYLLARPTTLTTSSLGPSQLGCLRLVSLLADPDAAVREIAAAVEADPALAFKILRAANSAAAGVSRRLSSVEHAVVLIGRETLQGWATLMMLGTPASETLLVAALVRARTCRTVAADFAVDPAASFLTGLLSGLAAPLGITLPALLEQLPVSEDVCRALLECLGPLAPVLATVLSYQHGELPDVRSPLTAAAMRHAYLDSVSWTQRTRTAVG